RCSLPLPSSRLPLLQHRLPLQMLSDPDSRNTGKDAGVQKPWRRLRITIKLTFLLVG
ncbi:hypothetical protein E4U16_000263, partial [Claviceps sp. LM84 group G4]